MINVNCVAEIIWTAFVYVGCGYLAFRLGEWAGINSAKKEYDRREKRISRKCSFGCKDKK